MEQLIQLIKSATEDFKKELLSEISAQIKSGLSHVNLKECEPPLLTTQELSKFLKVSKSTIVKLRKDPLFPAIKIGDSVRFQPSKVLEYLKTHPP